MNINELSEQRYNSTGDKVYYTENTFNSALSKQSAFIAGAELAIGFSQWIYDNCTEGYSYWMYDGLQYNHTELFQIYLNQLNNK